MMAEDGSDRQWHLDKRVPIALIFTIFMQSAAAVWWAAGINERIGQIERRQEAASVRSQDADVAIAEQSRKIAVLTEAVANTNKNLERMNDEIANTNQLLREFLLSYRENRQQ
jgi:septal ring factor EnvC (AmiA/AmiB activator)